jgi:hypothetical protein
MTCRAAARTRCQRARRQLTTHRRVVDVDVLAPTDALTNQWELDVVLDPRFGAIPADILGILAEQDLALDRDDPQGPFRQVVAIA